MTASLYLFLLAYYWQHVQDNLYYEEFYKAATVFSVMAMWCVALASFFFFMGH